MAQQNIDFGSFPNDPAADPIRAAFAKVQNNFDDVYTTLLSVGLAGNTYVTQITPDAGINLAGGPSTGNVRLRANINTVTLQTDGNLQVGSGTINIASPNTATTSTTTPFIIKLAPNVTIGNGTFSTATTSNLAVSNYVTTSLIPAGNELLDLGSLTHRWKDLFLSGNTLTIGNATVSTSGNTVLMPNVTVQGNVNAGNVTATYLGGTITSPSQPNITSVGILNGLSVSGDISGGNLSLTGDLAASGNLEVTGVFSAATITGNIVLPPGTTLQAPGSDTQLLFNDGGNTAAITGLTYNKTSSLLSIAGNLSGGNITTSGSMIALSANITGGANIGSANISGAANITGNINAGNLITLGILSANAGISANGAVTITNGDLSVTSNASIGNITSINKITGNIIELTGNVSGNTFLANYFSGNGAAITSINAANVTGTVSSAASVTGATQTSITTIGTLTALSVAGTLSGNAISGTNITASGYVLGSVGSSVTAAGTNQSSATTLTKQINVITSATEGSADGIKLPSNTTGMAITIINTTSAALKVYPVTGASIDALGSNNAYTLGAGARLQFIATSLTQWYTITAVYA